MRQRVKRRKTIEARLDRIAAELETREHELRMFYAERLDLWVEGTHLEPRMTHAELGTLSRERAGTVSQALSKRARTGAEY